MHVAGARGSCPGRCKLWVPASYTKDNTFVGITCAWCVLIIFEYLPRTRVRNFQPGFSFSSGTVPLRGLSGSLVLAAAGLIRGGGG